ncbi:hypothetical protein FNV43_RR05181 [Rhamnella rubrinervis]|uniref:ABC transporter domain-containing protein n=1 Tax=Rhamnella rubrinervis TaxID=2594499 RepID=A0A8K0MQZ7_9ROSA|nr:hypothetical protein FNV43_RR05181 [Rhamnella rubrinervis]
MAQMVGPEVTESLRIELAEIRKKLQIIVSASYHKFQKKLQTSERPRFSLFDRTEDDQRGGNDDKGKRIVDVTKLEDVERHLFIEKLIKHIEHDNLRLWRKIRNRIDNFQFMIFDVLAFMLLYNEAQLDAFHEHYNSTTSSDVIISHKKLSQLHKTEDADGYPPEGDKTKISPSKTTDKGLNALYIKWIAKAGVLTALIGVSGAGKTTLLDALSGRKTTGYVEGEIKVNGYPKVHETFARISCYCEQTDIHSPNITEFVDEVLEIIEFEGKRDALVGIPSVNDLSNEQPAIVMRAVKNVVDTGRTIVCTKQQPSIDIFESFHEGIPGVPKIKDNTNPATWMLEITSVSAATGLGLDFSQLYRQSALYMNNKELVKQLSSPPPGSRDLHFPTRFSQNSWGQFKSCLWKQHYSYWRNPPYNLMPELIHSTWLNVYCRDLPGHSSTVLQHVAMDLTVMYREKFAGMYSTWAYSLAQILRLNA